MRWEWLSYADQAHVTVVFGGWAVGAAAFDALPREGAVLLAQDYTHLGDPLDVLGDFDHVTLLAFSFGVASAAHWMAQTGFQPARKVAVSGTLWPADADRGIAPEMVQATADNLSEASFARFCRRAGMALPAPALDIPAAQEELRAIAARGPAPDTAFDRIWIPSRDRVIPTQAQSLAWISQSDAVRTVDAAHIPFATQPSWEAWTA